VISWGWESDHPSESSFIDMHEWQGTRDLSPFLAIGAAIDFVEAHDWSSVQREGHRLALHTRSMIDELTGLAPISPDVADPSGHEWIGQLASIRLPESVDVVELKARLYNEFRIEVPLHRWNDQPFVRVSFTAHTTEVDADALVSALRILL
jgi:isopenicillin-N epimerase